jgi:hypothetical protein
MNKEIEADGGSVVPVRERIERMIRDLKNGSILGYDGPQEYWSTRMGSEASEEVAKLLEAALSIAGTPAPVPQKRGSNDGE